MALTPYQRKIGVPDAPGPSGSADTRLVDISGSIARFGDALTSAFEAQHKQAAIASGSKIAGETIIERDEQGKVILPQLDNGGAYARAAFDQVIAKRYVNEVQLTYQLEIEQDMADRRTGKAAYDPQDFAASQLAKLEGVMAGIDPTMRAEVGEVLTREMLQRVNQFTEEVGRNQRAQTIAGAKDLIGLYIKRANTAAERGESPEQVAGYHAAVNDLADKLETYGGLAAEEVAALELEMGWQAGDFQRYIDASRGAVLAASMISSASRAEAEQIIQFTELPYGGDDALEVTGEAGGTGAYVLPFGNAVAGSRFGAPRDGGTRSHVGVDYPAPAGTSVKPALTIGGTATVSQSAKGGNIVTIRHDNGAVTKYMHLGAVNVTSGQRVDSGMVIGTVGSTGNATGNTLHLEVYPDGKNAVDPLSLIGKEVDASAVADTKAAIGTLTREEIRRAPPEIREAYRRMARERIQTIDREEAAAERAAAEAARLAADEANTQRILDGLDGAQRAGIGGGSLTAEEKGVRNRQFAQVVGDWSQVHTPQGQANIAQYVQDTQFLPDDLQNWFANTVRSPQWSSALALYGKVEGTTLTNGAKVGDLLVAELDADTRALFNYAKTLRDSGTSAEAIGVALSKVSEGTGFTPKAAKLAYNEQGGNYEADRNQMLRGQFGLPEDHALFPEMQKRVDASFAAYMSIYGGNTEKALAAVVREHGTIMQRSSIFHGGVGPAALRRQYTPDEIQRFLAQEKDQNGDWLIPRIKGQRLGVSLKLEPLPGSITRNGAYRLYVFDPDNPTRLLETLEFDLGKGLKDWKVTTVTSNRKTLPTTAEQKAQREAIARPGRRLLERDRAAPFAGPKY